MPRLTFKLLLKTAIIVFALLIFLPILLNKLTSKENGSHKIIKKHLLDKDRINRVKKVNENIDFGHFQNEDEGVRFHPDQLDSPDKIQADQLQAKAPPGQVELEVQRDNNDGNAQFLEDHGTKTFGPKAVFKEGVLGNYEPIHIKPKNGPGEKGEPVYTTMSEKTLADRSLTEFGFNMVASDKISMNRSIPDTRLDECKYWHYPEDLPTASVIIVFHNEGWSTLMRTVHSVLDMSPPHLLHEIVMVDDFSDKVHLKGKLDDYVQKTFKGKVKVFRNPDRFGLIKTRTLGASYSTGGVIVFLDAHCECNKNWLTPLLARVAYDRTIMAVPTIDGIDFNTFRYSPVYGHQEHYRGIFEWGFLYKESKVPDKVLAERVYNSEPYKSPTHAGGLFAMDRKYFFELGAYDPGLLIWGGENFELSFKIWQCGGSIEWVPCSRVGHVYRNAMPYGFGKISPKIPLILLNYMRVVEVWLDDEHKEYFYAREPTIRGYPIGDISKQVEFKQKNQCKSFKWFVENVAYEVLDKFPPPPPNKAWGEIQERHGYHCWDTRGQHAGGGPIGMSGCHHFGGNQLFRLNTKGQMGVGERCLEVTGNEIRVIFCPVTPTGPWEWDKDTGLIRHNRRNLCVTAINSSTNMNLKTCDPSDKNQQWNINEVRSWDK